MTHAKDLIFDTPSQSALVRVIEGRLLGPFLDQPIANLRAYANYGQGLEAVPFQVDEKNAESEYVLDEIGSDPADEKPGILDENDELVVRLVDAGLKSHQGLWPAGSKLARELELSDPSTGRRGYFYLFSFDSPPPLSPLRPTRYDRERDELESDFLKVGFIKEHPFIFNWVSSSSFDKGKKENIVDRLKVRTKARALGELVTINLDEEEIRSSLKGVRVGPVRVIRVIGARAKIGPMPEIPFDINYLFSGRLVQVPVEFRLPASISEFLSELDIEIGIDFRDIRGSTFSTLAINKGTLVDGKLSPTEKSVLLGDEEWIMVNGRGMNLFGVIDLDRTLTLRKEVHFLDDPQSSRPPESVAGQLPEIGFRLLNWKSLEGGRAYSFHATVADLAGFPAGGGRGFYKAIHHPPQVSLGQGAPPKALLVHDASAPAQTIGAVEAALRATAKGGLEGLSIDRFPLNRSARTADLEAIASRRADVVVFLADANQSEAREIVARRGSQVVYASADAGSDPLRLPPDRVIAMIRQCVPERSKVLFVTGSSTGAALWPSYQEAAQQAGVNLVHFQMPKGASPAQALLPVAQDASAIFIPPGPYWTEKDYQRLREAVQALAKAPRPVPVFAAGKAAVEKGAVLGLDAAAAVSPEMIATQAAATLLGQKAPTSKGSEETGTTTLYLNTDTLRQSRLQLPIQVLKIAKRIGAGEQ
ncbi:MAG: hypothetical protein AB1405_06590 [Bdellovibrionota bacterium]